jgi:alpha-D-ribose 1-methylphosphonate 5-triphosphate synthase subunit PhnG
MNCIRAKRGEMSLASRRSETAKNYRSRQELMALCAEARLTELEVALERIGYRGPVDDLRRPEVGLVMVRGRIGGDGRRFNFGEATTTRAVVRIDGGHTGFAYQLGRDPAKARVSAIIDALHQDERRRELVDQSIQPIRDRLEEERRRRDRQAAATRVNFFTMVRGEDE